MLSEKSRNWLSTSNKTNWILLILGVLGFLSGGSAISLPGLIASISGGFGLIKYRKIDKPDDKLPWMVLVSLVLLGLGLLSLLILLAINPVEQLERAKQLQ